MTIATARAHPNIALVKYWGKRDEELILPVAGSLSLTLDGYPTTTTVRLVEDAPGDRLELGGQLAEGETLTRVADFLNRVREMAGSSTHAFVSSHNEAPTAAGLASSASGFAALAVAAAAAYGLDLDTRGASRLARRGSGSAVRSIVPGVAIWHAGIDDASSYAEPIQAPEMGMVIAMVDEGPKAVSSRDAMRLTAQTSPFFGAWIKSTEETLAQMVDACQAGDFTRIGEITESHALRMHAVIASTMPPIRYLRPASIAIFDAVQALRDDGIDAYSTADAGPNVAVLVEPGDAERVAAHLSTITGVHNVRAVGSGLGAHLVDTPPEARL